MAPLSFPYVSQLNLIRLFLPRSWISSDSEFNCPRYTYGFNISNFCSPIVIAYVGISCHVVCHEFGFRVHYYADYVSNFFSLYHDSPLFPFQFFGASSNARLNSSGDIMSPCRTPLWMLTCLLFRGDWFSWSSLCKCGLSEQCIFSYIAIYCIKCSS